MPFGDDILEEKQKKVAWKPLPEKKLGEKSKPGRLRKAEPKPKVEKHALTEKRLKALAKARSVKKPSRW